MKRLTATVITALLCSCADQTQHPAAQAASRAGYPQLSTAVTARAGLKHIDQVFTRLPASDPPATAHTRLTYEHGELLSWELILRGTGGLRPGDRTLITELLGQTGTTEAGVTAELLGDVTKLCPTGELRHTTSAGPLQLGGCRNTSGMTLFARSIGKSEPAAFSQPSRGLRWNEVTGPLKLLLAETNHPATVADTWPLNRGGDFYLYELLEGEGLPNTDVTAVTLRGALTEGGLSTPGKLTERHWEVISELARQLQVSDMTALREAVEQRLNVPCAGSINDLEPDIISDVLVRACTEDSRSTVHLSIFPLG